MRAASLPAGLAEHADEVRERVAKNLSDLLKKNRWSRRAAATALGLTNTYVNSRASGDVDLSASDLAMFAEFLEVPVTAFFAKPADSTNVTPMPRPKAAGPGVTNRKRPVGEVIDAHDRFAKGMPDAQVAN